MVLQYVDEKEDKHTKMVGQQLISSVYANDGQDMCTTLPWTLGIQFLSFVKLQSSVSVKVIKEWSQGKVEFPRLVVLVRSQIAI